MDIKLSLKRSNVISVRDFIEKSKFWVKFKRIPIIILAAAVFLIPWLLTLNFEKSFYDIYRNLTEIENQIDLNGDWNTSAIVNYIPQILVENKKQNEIRKDPFMDTTVFVFFFQNLELELNAMQNRLLPIRLPICYWLHQKTNTHW